MGISRMVNRWLLVALVLWFILGTLTPAAAATNGTITVGDWEQFRDGVHQAFKGTSARNQVHAITMWAIFSVVLALAGLGWVLTRKQDSHFSNDSWHQTNRRFYRTSGQKRNWVRIPAGDITVLVRQVDQHQPEQSTYKQVRILDISGGGFMFASDTKLRIDEQIGIIIDMDGRTLSTSGRVARVGQSSRGGEQFLIGIEFVGLREGARDNLVRWVFKRQRRLLKRKGQVPEGTCLQCGRPLPDDLHGELTYCSHCMQKNF